MEGTPWRMQITMETVNPVGQLLQFIINIESVKYILVASEICVNENPFSWQNKVLIEK